MKEESAWGIDCEGFSADFVGFAYAYRFDEGVNVPNIAKSLAEGVVACSPMYIAGTEHIRRVLDHAAEYWVRKMFIARNRSIDLLMRVTCQSQISKALMASKGTNLKELAIFGLSQNQKDMEKVAIAMEKAGGVREDSLLELSSGKEAFLRKLHGIPSRCPRTQIVDLLGEKSVLLIFAK